MSDTTDDHRLIAELELLNEEARRRASKDDSATFCPHQPTSKQAVFLNLDDEKEVLFGGSVGGGKSDALLMAALKYVHVPNYSALILRRTYADLSLPSAIMDRAQTWLRDTPATWRAVDKQWAFPSGARLTFGYINVEKDRFRYSSAEFSFIGFDELTQFPERWYTWMFSRLRGPADPKDPLSKVPLRMRAATNPGNIGHEWVRSRWGIPDQIDFGHIYRTQDRCFVPSRLEDNPFLDGLAYDKALAELGPAEREQLRHGRWVRDSSLLVYKYYTDTDILIDEAPELDNFILGIDFGFKDDTAFTVIGWRKDDPVAYIVQSFKRTEMTPSDVAEVVTQLMSVYSFQHIIGDVGGLGKGYAQEMIMRHGIPVEPAEKTNKRGYIDLFNGAMANGRMKVVRGQCDELVDEWKKLPWSDENHIKEHDGFANHCFVAGTKITTDSGLKAIEDISIGDRVLTRQGYRKVVICGQTGHAPTWRLETSTGNLCGTGSHRIWTENRGWSALDKLTPYDALLAPCQNTNQASESNTTARSSGGIRVIPTGRDEPVYNLGVEDVHEYFANGILVANCTDSALYGWRAAYSFLEHTPAAEPEHGTPEWRKSINDKMAEARRRNQIGEAVKSQQPHWRLHPSERRNRLR